MGNWKSRKLFFALGGAILVFLNDKFKLGLSQESIYSILGILGVYVIGQGVADAGSQGQKKIDWKDVKDAMSGVTSEVKSEEKTDAVDEKAD
jgi:hypothetical protein